MRKVINFYIFREIAFPFLMTIFVFTFVLLIGKILQVMDMMVNKGVRFTEIVKLVLFILPSFLTFTIPISLLIAILIGLGRLSGDNEITVMKASGISLFQIFSPIAFLSLIAFTVTVTIGLVAPLSNFAMKNLLFNIVKEKASIGIKEKVFNDDFKGLVIYADRISLDGDFMEGVMVSDNRLVKEPTTIIAPKGSLRSEAKTMKVLLRLERGSIHTMDPDLKNYRKTDFSTYDVLLDLSTALTASEKTSKGSVDMTIGELMENMKKAGIEETARRDFIIELNKKISIPLSCLIFGIMAVPLGIVSRRTGKSRGFAVGLFVVAAFYTLQLAGEALGETGKLPPAFAVWSPNLIIGSVGVYLFILAAKEKPFPISLSTDLLQSLYERWKGRRP